MQGCGRSLASHPSGASRQSTNRGQGVSKDTSHSPSSPCGPNGDRGLSLAVLFLSTFQLVPARAHQHPGPLVKERSETYGWERRRIPLQCNLRASLASLFQEQLKINLPCRIRKNNMGEEKNETFRGNAVKWSEFHSLSQQQWAVTKLKGHFMPTLHIKVVQIAGGY